MSALVAVYHRTGARADEDQTQKMLRTLADYGPGRPASHADGCVSLGAAQYIDTPEARHSTQPCVSRDDRFIAVFDLRLDNRSDLISALGLGPDSKWMSDDLIALRAWEKWGEAALLKMVGPMAMVLWDAKEQHLILARDPSGNRMLHYHVGKDRITVGSLPRAIHVLGDIPRAVDELKIIDALTQHNVDIERSYFEGVHQVAPGGLVRFGRTRVERTKWYSSQEQIRPITYAKNADYVEAARELLDTCVAAHLRSAGGVGAFMSGGLDSSTVAATAAQQLARQGKRLPVYTSVPDPDYEPIKPRGRYVDETPHVRAIAALHGNMDLTLVNSAGRGMFDAQDAMLQAIEQPIRNALNVQWIHEIARQAANAGSTTLLEGALGNSTLSYNGVGIYAESLRHGRLVNLSRQIYQSAGSWPARARILVGQGIAPLLPQWIWRLRARSKTRMSDPTMAFVAARKQAMERRSSKERAAKDDFDFFVSPPRDLRNFLLKMNEIYAAGTVSAFSTALRCMYGVDTRDPLADRRIQEWCYGVPHEQFILNGQRRSLMKRLGKGLLPEDIRLQEHGSGLQTADAHLRLSRDMDRIKEELLRVSEQGDIGALIDIERLTGWVENWPDAETFQGDPTGFAQRSVTLPMALQAARFMQRESGRN